MFTIKFCALRDPDTGERASFVYEVHNYRISRIANRDNPEYVVVSFNFGDNQSAEYVVGGKDMHKHGIAAVFISNSLGNTIESWRMHDADF